MADERGLSPEGWQIPTYEDWRSLIDAVGGQAGLKLKSVSGWHEDNGTNASGFNARPGGTIYCNGRCYGAGEAAVFAAKDDGSFYITGFGTLVGGFPRELGGRWAHGQGHGNDGLSVRCVRSQLLAGFEVVPGGVPNPGILFVNREPTGRSGHMGNTLTQCANGDVLAFYTNTSGILRGGHLLDGWSEYRRSTDGGHTWGEALVFPHSRQTWEDSRWNVEVDETKSAIVMALTTAPNGTVIAFSNGGASGTAVYHLSHDHARTWGDARTLDSQSAHLPRLTYDAAFVHEDTIYVMYISRGDRDRHNLMLYVSTDHGESFTLRSDQLFPGKRYWWYQTGRFLDDGRLVVHVYNMEENEDEYLYRTLSEDQGLTWSEPEVLRPAKRIRNPQMSDKIGGYYFMHGRSGSCGPERGNFVLYKSTDGLNWDEGVFLNRREGLAGMPGGQAYSANTVVRDKEGNAPPRLLIQASVGYSRHRVNTRHWWICPHEPVLKSVGVSLTA